MLPDSSVTDRLSRARTRLLNSDVDVFLLLNMKNIRYLTGFSGSDGALLLQGSRTVLLVDGRYITQAREETQHVEVIEYRDKIAGIRGILMDGTITTAGFEASAMTYESYANLQEKIPHIRLEPKSDDMGIRSVKDSKEIAHIREAAEIASRTLLSLQELIKPGIRERDIVVELEYKMKQNGAEGVSFPTIVASGVNSALPHASPGSRKLSPGDVVVIDFGATYEGYHSDETITFFLSFASSRQKEVYSIVKEAHDRAIACLKAGVPCNEIDQIARNYLEENGIGPFFSHGTGHGIGLDIHEPPRIAAPSTAILEAGMVVTIEPGAYFPGQWGLRIEDTVLVKEDGCEVLTKIPKDFITV